MKILSVLSSALILTASAQAELGSLFLDRYQLNSREFDIDHDRDGLTTHEEYFLGTNPFVANPPLALDIRDGDPAKVLLLHTPPRAVDSCVSMKFETICLPQWFLLGRLN